jgi:hypothetical protein
MFYLTCQRCRSKPATNGVYCVACCARKHAWVGTAHRSSCAVCGVVRFKKRKRTYRGQAGSMWQTWYDIDPATGEKPNSIPSCK